MSYGQFGNINDLLAGLKGGSLPGDIPDWLKNQFFLTQPDGSTSESGQASASPQWSYKYNLQDQGGKDVVQTGGGTNGLIDPKAVWSDPTLGDVTAPSNYKEDKSGWLNPATGIGLVLGGGLLGNLALGGGFFGGGSGGAAAGTGAFDAEGVTPSLYGGGVGPSQGAVAGAAPGVSLDPPFAPGMENTGNMDSWLINNGMRGAAGGAGTDILGGNFGAAGSSLFDSAMSNPLRALGLLQTGVGLARNAGILGKNNTPSTQGKSSGSPGAPMNVSRPQWAPNPYTLMQLQRYGGGGL